MFYFAVAMGAGPALAQEQDLLHYWWVMPREAPEHAPRVIRVIGAKGEAFEEVFDEEYLGSLKSDPALQQARQARQTSLRLEALALADELKAAGKSAVAAYEEAWTRVYSRRWLTADWRKGSSRLEDMLSRLASEHEDLQLTPEEEQWVLEALLEDDDRLETEQGVELLRRLSRRLRAMGYGRFYSNTAVQDELMERFAESLRLGKDSMAAYRDALFKTNRDRVMRHTLRGYVAPWGMGAGGVRSYRQAPQKISLTTATANTQAPAVLLSGVTTGKSYAAPGLNDLPAAEKNFLATAPSASAIGEDEEEKDDEKEDEEEKEKETTNALATAPAGSSAAPRMMMRSFSLRSSAPATYAAEGDDAVTLPANAITSRTNTTFHTNTSVNGHNLTYGNHYAASWGTQSHTEETGTFLGGTIKATISFDAWNGNTQITGTPDTFTLAGGNLYLGSGYTGEIFVSKSHAGSVLHAESLEHNSVTKWGGFLNWESATAHAVYQVPGSGVFRYGRLTGGGELRLSNNAAAGNAVIYSFSDRDGSGWFAGTILFGASREGIVELDLGEDAATTAWQNTVFNLTPKEVGTAAYSITSSTKPAATILNIRNNVTIAGLEGGDATSTVTNEAPTTDISHTLTLGDSTTNTYTYSGTFNRPYYKTATNAISPAAPINLTKIGSNTQIITQDVVADVPDNAALDGSLNVLTVQAGRLQFNGELEATKVHATGGQLYVGGNLTVTGGENTGSDTVALQITEGDSQTEVTVVGTTSAYNVNVLRGASLKTGSLSVSRILHIDYSGSRVEINGADSQPGQLSMAQLYVSNAGALEVQGSLSATTGVDIGTGTGGVSAVTVTGAFTTPDLRLRSNARLETGSSVQVGSGTLLNGQTHLHGGGEWKMTGTANTLTGTLYLEDTATNAFTFTGSGKQSGAVVLTLPGVIDFARSGWDGTNATMHLNGVTLDFSRGVQLVNTGLTLKAEQTLTLASLSVGSLGWYQPAEGSVTVWGNNGLAYHALLGKDENHIILTIQHEIKVPFEVGSGSLVYLEMYSNAASPALPYKAYTGAKYKNSSWSGTSVEASHLLKFSNIQLSENAGIYLGELDKNPAGSDYKADHHFGGNVSIVATDDASGDAASLHGQQGTWGNWLLDGHLGGSGTLKLVAHHGNTGEVSADTANNDTNNDDSTETVDGVTTETTVVTTVHGSASVFSFTNAESPADWFSGELGLANPEGGIVQLNVGNVNIAGKGDTRWDGVVLDLQCSSYTDASDASGKTGTASAQVLGVVGDATVAGLRGSEDSSVVAGRSSNSLVPNPTLTLGDDTDETYTFGGSIGSGRFYTGGQAYSVTTTVTTTDSSGDTLSEPSSVTRENNFYTSRQGGLNLVKIGSSIQEFAGSSCLDQVDVQAGTLIFSGSDTVINDVIVHKGATLQTDAVSLGSATLFGGSTWITTADTPNSYETPVYLADVFGAGGAVSSITLDSNGETWTPTMYLNMQDAGTWTENSGAIFTLKSGTMLDVSNPRVITNMSGISGGSKIALYSGWTGTSDFADNLVMVEDTSGNFYDADYKLENGTLYLQLEEQHLSSFGYGISINQQPVHKTLTGYVWSGEDNGTVIAKDVHYVGLVLGSVWRADGSAENTGWHEQRAVGSTNDDIGVYENGNTVYFLDTNVHRDDETHRKVIIQGQVAPGEIVVDARRNLGYVGTAGQEAQMQYAYAFVAGDDTACITDFGNKATSITKKGKGLLVLNLANTFTGGIDVQDGGLYLAAVNAAGTGTLTFHTDEDWEQTVVGYSSKLDAVQKHHGAELMVCYAFDTNAVSAFRGSTLGNDIKLTSSDPAGGQFTVSFAYAGYNSVGADDHANLPRHWRNLTLSGALVGTGAARDVDKLVLTGYSSTWSNCDDQSYVTVLTLNEDTAGAAFCNQEGEVLNRFNGTVVLKNTINTSPLPSNDLDDRTAGTVQVVLKGDKLKEARLDLTREQHNMGASFEEIKQNPSYADWYRQTYNNILVLNDDASVRGLTAEFRGIGWDYPETSAISGGVTKYYRAAMPQNDEVWHVRTVTNGLNTLRIGTYGDATDTNTYVYSGAMGFEQAYAGTAQGHIPWGDGFFQLTNASWKYGGHSMGVAEALSLVKSSKSAQYIHTALLNDVSVYEGTLGFNNLELAGNLNLVGDSRLELGTTGSMADGTTWNKIESDTGSVMQSTYEKVLTSDTVEVHADKTMTVITMGTETLPDEKVVPQTAVVQGNVTLEGDAKAHTSAALTFRLNNNVLPYSLNINQLDAQGKATGIISTADNEGNIEPLLTVTGNLTIANQEDIAVTLTGANFSLDQYGNKKYYLARADEIIIGSNGDETDFVQRNISLGYGYFGILYTVGDKGSSLAGDKDNASSYDYLVMSITGDPRRTWSGHVTQIPKNGAHDRHVWFNTENKPATTEYDYRWKENKAFQEAHVVLFGNLYQPVEWTVQSELLSDQSVYVKNDVKHDGTTVRDRGGDLPTAAAEYDFNIDGCSLESVTAEQAAAYNLDYQAVRVEGAVKPFSIIINSDYYLCSGVGYTTKELTTDGTNYYFYTTYSKDANGNIIEDSIGRIEDASREKLEAAGFDGSWKTMLHKSGTGTTVIALDNSFSGGSVLQGGRLVMQHRNALGTGGITLMNGAALQGDFLDENMSGTGSSLGRAMDSTTIANTVTVNVYADPDEVDYDSIVDGRLINSYNKKLILTKLVGESDTVLELNGVGSSTGDKYRYGVFKVLDPSGFAGTITMSGHVWGHVAMDATIGGMVQLDIMSTTKSGAGADWTKAVVDLSVNTGTDRTVLALDATGELPDGGTYEYCVLDSITGSINTSTGSSSVLNISAHNPITLVLKGLRNGDYDGVLGYGDFQVAVNYGGYAEAEQGTTRHHYGAVGHGSLNVIKEGEGSVQKVQRAWLNGLTVEGGTFQVEEALVAHDIKAGRGKRVMVGNADVSSLYALTVGAGGTLAMNTTFAESGQKQDAWEKLEGGSTDGDSNRWVAWVLLENGATLSAREDWYTARQVDIASGAGVTINTHNFAIDPYINADNDPFGKYKHSHIIQLLGKLTGQNVTLTLNNQLTNPANKDAVRTDVASEYMGYVAIRNHNDFTGSNRVNVEAMTALQILGSNDNVEADVDMTVRGRHATVQVVDGLTQYIDSVVLGANNLDVSDADPLGRPNNGQIILGGLEVTTLAPDNTNYRKEPDKAGAQVFIAARHDETPLQLQSDARAAGTTPANQVEAAISHLHIDLSGAAVRMGGEEGHASVASNAHVDVVDKVTTHVIHDTDFLNSIIHLQEDCSINIAEAVLLDYQSVVTGSVVNQSAGVVDPLVGPVAATGQNSESWTKEVTTSRATTVQLTFADAQKGVYKVGDSTVLVLQTEQFQGVDLTDNSLNGFSGLTIQLYEDMIAMGYQAGAQYIALMVDGGSGRFLYEQDNQNFDKLLGSEFVLQDRNGNNMEGYWISSTTVEKETGAANVSMHMLYFRVPEPATTTLSLLALTALCARRRRKR